MSSLLPSDPFGGPADPWTRSAWSTADFTYAGRASWETWLALFVAFFLVVSNLALGIPSVYAVVPTALDDAYTVAEGGSLTTVGPAVGTWDLPDWRLRRSITFNNTGRGQLDNFPVLVKLDPADIDYTRTQGLGQDLRFVDSDGTPLAYEIEEWNTAGSYVWVKVPQIDAGSTTDFIWMYYDNGSVGDAQNPGAVWSNGYVGVWHMDQNPGASQILDSTSYLNHGSANNMDLTNLQSGRVGDGMYFDGSAAPNAEYVRVPSDGTDELSFDGASPQLTLEAWARRTGSPTNEWMVVVGRQVGIDFYDSYTLATVYNAPDVASFVTSDGASTDRVDSAAAAVPFDEWRYLTAVRNGNNMVVYSNGSQVGSGTAAVAMATDNNDVTFAAQENDLTGDPDESWRGLLDEIRISEVPRTADWVNAQHASMTDTFGAYGLEEEAGVLSNDTDPESDVMTAILDGGPAHAASFSLNADGSFTYTPVVGMSGTDSFTYVARDVSGDSNVATVTITVTATGSNSPPDAVDDPSAVTTQDVAVVIDVLANDTDPDPDTLTVSAVTQGANGTVVNNGTDVTYTPGASWTGVDTFTYEVSDGNLGFDTATVTVTVSAPATFTISGTVFEDIAGDVLNDGSIGDASNPGAVGVDVYLYEDTDHNNALTVGAGDTLIAGPVATDALGFYSFSGLANETYFVVVDSRTVPSALAPATPLGDIWAVQTYGPSGGACANGSGSAPERGTTGPCYGGITGVLSDSSTMPIHRARMVLSGANITNVDFGFSFNVVVNTRGGNAADDDPGNRTVQGSLRQFIQNAVAISGPNAMRFVPVVPTNATDGGGNDWWSVPVTVALPTASSAATTIDGTAYQLTDGTTLRNTNALGPELELNGTGTAATVDGLLVTGGTSAVRDLVINRFGRNGILITTAGNNTIAGNYLGTDATGSADLGNGNDGIRILSVPGNTIGGLNPGDRNVISGNGNNGLLIDGVAATGNIIQGNYVGLNAAGTAAIGNFDDGVDLSDTPGNTVGGTDPAARNVISGQGDIGLLFVGAQSTGNVAVNNYIGTNAAGDAAVPNLTGVSAYNDAAGNRIGGVNANEANLIAFNTGDGVWIQATAGVNNSVLRNSIHTNGGLGIDTEADGVHINTLADPLNLPVITAASESAGTVTVDFDLDVPAGDYRIEFFTNLTADPSGNGEGQTFATFYDLVGHPGVPTSFSVPLAGAGWVNLTATTTKDFGAGSFGSTSEFSDAFVVVRDTLVVNSTGDAADANPGDGVCFTGGTNFDGDPECTLRAAIEESNALAGADTVSFNIPVTEPGYAASPLAFTLNPASQYPVVTGQVTLDATSQPQYTGDPIIQLDGTLAIGATAGLVIGGSNNTVAGFILHSFEDEGLEVDGSPGPADNNTLRNNWIGLDAAGTVLGNDGNGILLTEAADGNMIGGTGLNDGNVIAGSGDRGISIRVNSVGNTVIGNSIYGNTQLGIDLDEDGVTVNDLNDLDSGSNDLLNFPEITSAVETAGTLAVDFDLDLPAGNYRIEFFTNTAAHSSGNGEGKTLVATYDVVGHVAGSSSYSTSFAGSTGNILTATTTEDLGASFGSTSEFSLAFTVGTGAFVINSTGDSGDNNVGDGVCDTGGLVGADSECTLRAAIEESNFAANANEVSFNIPTSDAGYSASPLSWTITPLAPYDDIVNTVSIDATTQPGFVADPVIQLVGSDPGAALATAALTLEANDSLIEGFIVHSWLDEGLEIDASTGKGDNNTLRNNWVGIDAGEGLQSIGDVGILVTVGANDNTITGNVVGGATNSGILIRNLGTDDNIVTGNSIGVGPDGTAAIPNALHGIEIQDQAAGNRIGGLGAEGNVIANNGGDGVRVLDTAGINNTVLGNSIHSNIGLGIDAHLDGVTANGTGAQLDFPVITSAIETAGTLTVDFDLGVPDGSYRVEFFTNTVADGSGNGEGETFVSSVDVSVTAGVPTPGSHTFAGSVGDILSATATGGTASPFGPTSEFSNTFTVAFDGFVVNSTGDLGDLVPGDGLCDTGGTVGADSECTLRAAIEQANALAGADIIVFNIPNTDPGYSGTPLRFTIQPGAGSPLPAITEQATIDGSSQPEYTTEGRPVVEVDGSLAGGNGLEIMADDTELRGLVINRFATGVAVLGGDGSVIAGNYIGPDVTGLTGEVGNTVEGVLVYGATNTVIGGTDAADQNLISGNRQRGINVDDFTDGAPIISSGTQILGNYIGTNAAGTASLPYNNTPSYQQIGLYLLDSPNGVVGTTTSANVLSGNSWYGIYIWGANATGNRIQSNIIGLDATATNPVPNAFDTPPRAGILLSNAPGNLIGGTVAGEGNVIAANADVGITVAGAGSIGNAILGNRIYNNVDLGIDLNNDGVTPNDLVAGDFDSGPNDLLNFPVITSATESAGTVTVDFDLDVPAGNYRIEFFTSTAADDPTGYGEGERFTTFHDVVGHPGVPTSFSVPLAGAGWVMLTATTTEDLGAGSFGSTSEFSAAVPVVRDTLVVNSTGDASDDDIGDGVCFTGGTNIDGDPECTLRAAMEEAEALAGADTVNFSIPTTEPGYTASPLAFTLNPASQYPAITGPLTLDATSQPGYTGDPIIQLDGTLAAGATAGLVIEGSDSTIAGFIVHSFQDEGLEIDGLPRSGDNNIIRNNWVGVDASGVVQGNTDNGILITDDATGNLIGGTGLNDGNVIAGSGNRGINIRLGSIGNTVIGNSIYGNTQLGIDLNQDGVTENDTDDLDSGPNDLLNFPEIASAVETTGTVDVDFDLDLPAGNYRIEFFTNTAADPSGNGEGETLVATYDVVGHVFGSASYSTSFAGSTGDILTATTTKDLGAGSFGSTSEFSDAYTVTANAPPVFAPPLANQTDPEGPPLISLSVAATDPEGDTLTYSATGLPLGLTLATDTGLITGLINHAAAASSPYSVQITVDDGVNTPVSDTFSWTVTNVPATIPYVVAGTGGANGGDDLLTNVDETSFAAATNEVDIGTGTGTSSIEAIATDPTNGTLYAVNGGQFGSLDTDSGVFTPIGTGLGTAGGTFGELALDDVRGLAFHPLNDRLYGVHRRAGGEDVLFRIDVATGAHISGAFPGGDDYRRVQAIGAFDDVTDIAVDPLDWEMYAVMTDGVTSELATVKRNTGKTKSVGALSASLTGLSFTSAGQLWGTDAGALYTVDKTDGSLDAGRTLDNGSNYGALAFGVDPASPPSVEGTVFEDLDGNALGVAEGPDDLANPGVPGVAVHLYQDLGVAGVPEGPTIDIWEASTVTGPTGHYFFDEIPVGPYWIVVESTTIAPVAGGTGWAEQTYAPVGAVIDGLNTLSGAAGPLFGGPRPTVSDGFSVASGLTSAEHLAFRSFAAGEIVEDIDFGFSFNVVTNLEGADATSPQGSFRQFLTNAANGAGPNPMRFVPVVGTNATDGGGNNWWSLAVSADLPFLSDDDTTIDGAAFDSNDGITPLNPNAAGPELEIDGPGAAMDGLTVTSADNTIRNLVIGGFTDVDRAAVVILGVGATGNTIAGNYLGTTATGNGANGNQNGVRITGGANTNTVGGTAGADLNVISGNLDNGVLINGGGSDDNIVQGNFIGTDAIGTGPLANGQAGVAIDVGAAGNLIGGTTVDSANRISNNGSDGVRATVAAGNGNSILRNVIVDNTGLGIDLGPDGITENAGGDPLNFPVITSATYLAGTVNVDFDLVVPDGNYRVEFFTNTAADPSGNGEGETFVSSVDVSVTGGVPTPGSHSFAGSLGDILTATATEGTAVPFGSTSEFSDSVVVVNFDTTPPVITLVGGSPIDVEAGSVYVDAGATATDNIDGDLTGSIVTVNPVDTGVLGSYSVTYNVSDSSGNAAVEVTRTVNVVDTTIPVITRLGVSPVSVALNDTYVDAGATAVDAFEGDITADMVTVNPVNTAVVGTYVVTYNVADASGNNAVEVTRTVDVVLDGVPPVITLVGGSPIDVEAGSVYVDAGATATDNIDGDLTGSIVTVNPVDTGVLGSYSVTYNVSDSSGNAAVEVTRTVNVVDTTIPVITRLGVSPVSVALNDTYVDAGATAVDAFEGDITADMVTVNPVNTAVVGTYVVTYNVADASGNNAVEVTRTVDVVLDGVPPVITLVGGSPIDVEAGSVYVDAGATATDNIDGDLTGSIVTVNPVDTGVLGSYSVTYNVSDSSGNAAVEVTRTVNVVDTTIPVITRLGVSPVSVALNDTYVDAGATAVDAFEGDITADMVTVNPVNTAVVGTYVVTYNVADASGNNAVEVTRTVDVVLDGVPPVITLVGGSPIDVEAGSVYVDAGATATDNIDGDLTGSIVTVNPVDTGVLGSYSVTYNVSDSSGNAAVEVTRTVNVVDTTIPVITRLGVSPVSVALNDTYVDAGATAVDAFEGDITADMVTVNPVNTAVVGTYVVTYNVADASGNNAVEVTRTVDVVLDGVPPVITLVGGSPIDVEAGSVYVDAGATATDNIDGDLTGSIVTVNPVDTGVLGSYSVTYNVSDSSGNAAVEVTRTVNVVDTTIPVITRLGVSPVSVALNDTYVDAGATAVDAFEGDITADMVTVNPVNTAVVGTYVVTYNVADASGNNAVEVTRTVDVVLDGVPPVITLVGGSPIDVEAGSVYVDAGATATDNIDGDLTGSIVTVNPVDTGVLGSYSVTYNVSDSSGNAAVEVTRTVNVVDTTIPVITRLGVSPVSVALNDTYVDAGATAVDAFEGDITADMVTVNPVNTAVVGTYVVTYNVADASGNNAVEVTRTVDVVLDGVPPVITLVGGSPIDVEAGSVYVDAGATATDNIDGDLTGSIVTVNPVDTGVLGSYSVTYNVSDSSGNAAVEVTRTVNVVDTTIPVITRLGVSPVSVALNDTYVDAGATAVDAFEGDITADMVTVNPVNTAVVGTYVVTYNVADASGNNAVEVTRTVDVVLDGVPPVITLVGGSPIDVEAGSVYVDAGATATDNIDGDLTGSIVTVNPVDTGVLGSYSVTYNVSDSSGNAAVEVTRTVNVVDTTIPVITRLGVSPVSVALNDTYVDAGATAVDAFEGDITADMVTVNPVNTAVVGTYVVTYNVADASGNNAVEVTRTVDVVLDGVPPVITLVGGSPIDVEAGSVYVDAGATATDNIDGDLTGSIVTVNPVDTGVLGSYSVTYNVSDSSGNAAVEVTRTVNVVDTTIPVITRLGVSPVSVALNDTYVDAGATAVDAFEGDITADMVTVNPVNTAVVGTYVVTYNVADASGNNAVEVTRTVDVVLDGVPPVITLVGGSPIDVEAGSVYVDAGATATDNIDGDLTGSIVTVNPVDTGVLGSYSVTYNVSDSSGNAAVEVTRTVNVVDTTIPVITRLGVSPVSVALNDTYVDAGATAVDAFEGDITADMVTVNPVNTAVVGTYVVTYNVADASGNNAVEVTRTVDVVLDGVPPVITLVGGSPIDVEAGSVYVDAGATATDNIDGDLTGSIVTVNPVDTGVLGSYSVTYNVSDSSGNAAVEVTRTVNVVDTTIPVITRLGVSPVSVALNDTYVDAGATAVDAFEGDITADMVTVNPVNTAVVGTYVVTYNVADASGNNAVEVTRTVDVVLDGVPPVITLVGGSPIDVEAGSVYVDAGATAFDNIDGDLTGSIVIDASAINTFAPGVYAVTYDVTDSSGNSALQELRLVQVADTQSPVITLLGDNPQTVAAGTPYIEMGATAADGIDGDLTGSIVIDTSAVNTAVPGSYTVSYSAADSSGNATTVFRSVDVVFMNAPPVVANPGVQTTGVLVDVTLQVAATDPDDDALTFGAAGLPPGLSISSGGLISGTVPVGGAGTYPVTVTVTDDGIPTMSDSVSFVWVVTDDNQAPIANSDQYTVDEGGTLVVGAPGVLGNDSDPDTESLTAVLVTPPTRGTLSLAANGSFVYTHTAGDAVDDSFTYIATDARGATDLAVVVIRVLENLAPVVVADLISIDEDTVGTADVLANDLDPEGAVLTIVGIEQPLNGVVTQAEDGTLSFAPKRDWFGTTRFAYLVSDGRKSTRGLVTVRVAAVNDLPVGGRDSYRFTRYGPAVLDVLANDTDVDGDTLFVAAVGGVSHALAEVLDGQLTYNAHSEWLGTETFTYTLSDGHGGQAEVLVSVTMADEALTTANQLSGQVGVPDVPFDSPEASPATPSISLGSPKGVSLLAGAFFDSFDALKLPFGFLLIALLWALVFGGLFSTPWFLFGARRRFWSIVLVDRESMVSVYAEPTHEASPIYNYPPSTQNIRSTGPPKRYGTTWWMPIDTPNGEGWVDAYHLTQEVDDETFARDERPAELAAKFVSALTAGKARAMQKLVSKRGLAAVRFGTPVVVPLHRLKALLSREKEPGWWRSDALTAMEALFPERLAEPFLGTYWAGNSAAESGKAATLLVPAEIRNFHRYTYSNAEGTWWLLFEYRKNKLTIAGIALAE